MSKHGKHQAVADMKVALGLDAQPKPEIAQPIRTMATVAEELKANNTSIELMREFLKLHDAEEKAKQSLQTIECQRWADEIARELDTMLAGYIENAPVGAEGIWAAVDFSDVSNPEKHAKVSWAHKVTQLRASGNGQRKGGKESYALVLARAHPEFVFQTGQCIKGHKASELENILKGLEGSKHGNVQYDAKEQLEKVYDN